MTERADLIERLIAEARAEDKTFHHSYVVDDMRHFYPSDLPRRMADALAALSSPQKPVAWRMTYTDPKHGTFVYYDEKPWTDRPNTSIEPLYASPVEPVAAAKAEEGWRLVPIESTDAMGLALPKGYRPGSHSAAEIYRTMVAAAPTRKGEGL